jgi:hypothetical protein
VGEGVRPIFSWRTYLRSVSDGNPRSAATCAIGRPDSNTSRVARSNNSTGYFLALGMTDLLPPGEPWHAKSPSNPGWLILIAEMFGVALNARVEACRALDDRHDDLLSALS